MGKLTTTTTITCSVPNPSCDHDILAVMCQLTDAPAVSFENKADAQKFGKKAKRKLDFNWYRVIEARIL